MQVAVFVLGVLVIAAGIVLFIRGVGGGGDNYFEALGMKVKFKDSALVLVAFGIVLIVVASRIDPPQPVRNGNVSPSPGPSSPAPLPAMRLAITPPARQEVQADLKRHADGSISWEFWIEGTLSGVDLSQRKWLIYPLYRAASSEQDPWYVQNLALLEPNGRWKAKCWVDDPFFKERPDHKVQLRAVAVAEPLSLSSKISLNLSSICPPHPDPCPMPKEFSPPSQTQESTEVTVVKRKS